MIPNKALQGPSVPLVEAQALCLDEIIVEITARTEDELRSLAVGMILGKH